MVGLDPQTREHADVAIAQGRRVLRSEIEVLAVLEAAAGEEDGEIFRGVPAGVAGTVAGWGSRGLSSCELLWYH